MKETVNITINGTTYRVQSGQTIMQAADACGYHIPRLCYHPELSIEGACRVCIVAVEGQKNYAASCASPVQEGMVITTNSAAIRRARRDIVELLVDNHPKDCHTCERDGNCELQHLAFAMGIRKRHFEGERKAYEQDLSSPSVVRDPEKCVLCARCVRMCEEIQGVHALGTPTGDSVPWSCRHTTCRLVTACAVTVVSASMSAPQPPSPNTTTHRISLRNSMTRT